VFAILLFPFLHLLEVGALGDREVLQVAAQAVKAELHATQAHSHR